MPAVKSYFTGSGYRYILNVPMDNKKTVMVRLAILAVIVFAIVAGMKLIIGAADVSAKYDEFAQCLVKKGVKFYGAFWCPHCQAQEQALGMSRDKLASIGLYSECSNPDRSQNALCTAVKIESYPTWVFPDGTRSEGAYTSETPGQDLSTLAQKSGCALPSATAVPTK